MLWVNSMEKKFLEFFTKTNSKKTNQEEFRTEKVIKRKDNKLYAKWKGYNNLIVGLIKKDGINELMIS